MEAPPETDPNLADATKRVAWRLLATCHNRAELLLVEIQEERERLRMIIFLAAGAGILGLLAGITLTAVIVCAAGAYRLPALVLLAILYTGGAVLFYIKLTRLQRDWESFSDTRDQLEKDRKCFEKTLT
jgi:uncharacterized membrane protein YqjE